MPTRTGYKFGGYYTGTNGGGTQYYTAAGASARNWDRTSATTLYAKWTANQYKITLDRNGGSGGTEVVYATWNAAMPQINLPTWTGHTFDGYYFFHENGSETKYYNADGTSAHTSNLGNNTILHAKWIQNPIVTFVLNGGTFQNGWVTPTNYVKGVGMTLPTAADITYTNRAFIGWYEDEMCLGDRVTKIRSDDEGDRTFYAHWEGRSYKVSFDVNGGKGRDHQEQSLPMTNSERLKTLAELYVTPQDGYTFAEWNTAVDGSGDSYLDGAVIENNLTNVANATVTLYAQWTPNPYKVAFNPNGADGGETMTNQWFTYDVAQPLNAVEFTYTGHAFKNWSSDTNYNYYTKYYLDGAVVTNLATGGDVNLYANWTGIVYTVSFDANEGTGSMDPLACTYNVWTNLPHCTFTRDGWGFSGWMTNVNDEVLFADRARVTNLTTKAEEVTLYASWTGVTYNVTLDARDWRGNGVMTNGAGEVVSVLTNAYTVGDDWILPVPTNEKPHLAFAGWKDNWGEMVCDGAKVPLDSAGVTNLVAVWSDSLAAAVDAPELEFATFGTVGQWMQPNRDDPYSADWFAQTNFVYSSTNAVQSGSLPICFGDGNLYVSWLITKVQGRGVLSFWWKCDACPLETVTGYEVWAGDTFRFGVYDPEGQGMTNEVVRLTNHVDWCHVTYTNQSESTVYFAWAFVYTDSLDKFDNGGGTGWVDRVIWTPEGSVGKLSSISISGDESVVSGSNATYTCTAMMSDGATKPVTPTWSVESGASYAEIDPSGVLTAHAADALTNVTIKASYAEDDVTATATKTVTVRPVSTVSFNPNGGTLSGDSFGEKNGTAQTAILALAYGETACNSGMRAARPEAGHVFNGFWTSAAGGSQVYAASGEYVPNSAYWTGDGAWRHAGDVDLYAQWTVNAYTVTFDANGGSGAMEPLICICDAATNLPHCTFTRDGWAFAGWATNGTGDVLFADEARVLNLATSGNEAALYACWTGVTYDVTLNANGGLLTNGAGEAVGELVVPVTVGTAWNLPDPTNVDESLTFNGWTNAAGQKASDIVPPSSSGFTNLAAVWFKADPLALAVDAPELSFETFGTVGSWGRPNEDPYSARWFAQSTVFYKGANAVQSGDLPNDTGDGLCYVSWLTTTVEGKGVLSFMWRCSAPDQQVDYGIDYGDCLEFWVFDPNGGGTNKILEIANLTEWIPVTYTNESATEVSFAWAFKFRDDGMHYFKNGGGTGWVDRVTWTPDGTSAAEATTEHRVPFTWLREKFSDAGSMNETQLETLAESDSPNGKPMKVWQDYWAGTNPYDPNDLFRANIAVTNDVPYISWQPDLSVTGDPVRVYQVLCAPTPSAQEWVEWPGPGGSGASTNRFFKVELILEEE